MSSGRCVLILFPDLRYPVLIQWYQAGGALFTIELSLPQLASRRMDIFFWNQVICLTHPRIFHERAWLREHIRFKLLSFADVFSLTQRRLLLRTSTNGLLGPPQETMRQFRYILSRYNVSKYTDFSGRSSARPRPIACSPRDVSELPPYPPTRHPLHWHHSRYL